LLMTTIRAVAVRHGQHNTTVAAGLISMYEATRRWANTAAAGAATGVTGASGAGTGGGGGMSALSASLSQQTTSSRISVSAASAAVEASAVSVSTSGVQEAIAGLSSYLNEVASSKEAPIAGAGAGAGPGMDDRPNWGKVIGDWRRRIAQYVHWLSRPCLY